MIAFDLVIEPHGPITLEQHEYEQAERRRAARIRPHCAGCGRFVRAGTVWNRSLGGYECPEVEPWGKCPDCGDAPVVYERP